MSSEQDGLAGGDDAGSVSTAMEGEERHDSQKNISVPPLGCNCSIGQTLVTKRAVVVDPGGAPERAFAGRSIRA